MEKWKKSQPNYHNRHVLEQFHRDTFHLVSNTSVNTRDVASNSEKNRHYSDDGNGISLNNVTYQENIFEKTVKGRRTSWEFDNPMDFDCLSKLLALAFDVTAVKPFNGQDVALRAYPSAGAAYSISIYVYIDHVRSDVNQTIFRYDPNQRRLNKVNHSNSDVMNSLASATRYKVQDLSQAKVIFFLATDFKALFPRYGLLTYRLSLLEAGHMAQNLQMVATYLGLNPVPIGGFYDIEVKENVTGSEDCLYIHAIG
ncbi:MAG TPA: SagB/ThcOx family dehydrogenase [Bacillota bacterium]|nr:SagB/ThcOx family dehydrogenase [Bacillota bacterium]